MTQAKQFTKADLKTGMIAVTRRGERVKQEQKAVIEVSSKVENIVSAKPRATSQSFLKSILSPQTSV